jgi:hypothetical protein
LDGAGGSGGQDAAAGELPWPPAKEDGDGDGNQLPPGLRGPAGRRGRGGKKGR